MYVGKLTNDLVFLYLYIKKVELCNKIHKEI